MMPPAPLDPAAELFAVLLCRGTRRPC